MRLLSFVLVLLGGGLLLRADPPPGYYGAAEGKRGLALRQALHGIVRNHRATDSDSWEPPESVKGDIARAMFYMTVRYTGDAAGEPTLTLTDAVGQITASGSSMGRYTVLVQWHLQDPVDMAEARRNDAIYRDYQANRNPFVDRPEWVLEAFMPQLTLAVSGTNATLEWAADASPIVLLEATRTVISRWSTVTNVPTRAGAVWKVTLPLEPEERFFRLRLS